jgi:hypothetical protein
VRAAVKKADPNPLLISLQAEREQKDDKIGSLENTVNTMQSQIQSLISAFSNMKEQTDTRRQYGQNFVWLRAYQGSRRHETITTRKSSKRKHEIIR